MLFYMLFVIDWILCDWSWQFIFNFVVECTYTISHVIILFGLFHRPYPVGANLYDRSRHYPISSLSWTARCLICLDSLVLYSTKITLVQLVTSLSCLLFVINRILFDRLWHFCSDFSVDHSCTISHVLFYLVFIIDTIGSVMIVQFRFWHRANLYDRSCCCPISSSS